LQGSFTKAFAIEMLFQKRPDWKSFVRDLPDGNVFESGWVLVQTLGFNG